ncbi:MAG: hypothetical protein GY795_09540 [Desulfobacterales bacterium]|nr:hypothetical protein [Desulfobacterales bacterium]
MAYSKFTLKDVKEKLGIQVIENERLFSPEKTEKIPVSEYLRITLDEFSPLALAINTEKSRSEWIIAPVLAELRKKFHNQISLFSGTVFNVDEDAELGGLCDYLISLNSEQFYISAPVLIIAEAKKENIIGGFGQCIATMHAADLFNKKENNPVSLIFGAVTTGSIWKFIKLENRKAYIDIDEYHIKEIEALLGILFSMVSSSKDKGGCSGK